MIRLFQECELTNGDNSRDGLTKWLSRDPIRERGGTNLYAYVGNRVLWALDPLALQSTIGPGYGVLPVAIPKGEPKPAMPCAFWRSIYTYWTPRLWYKPMRNQWDDKAWFDQNRPNSVQAAEDYFKSQIEERMANFFRGLPITNIKDYTVGPGDEALLGDPEQSILEFEFWIGWLN